jgi:hypothetical protein
LLIYLLSKSVFDPVSEAPWAGSAPAPFTKLLSLAVPIKNYNIHTYKFPYQQNSLLWILYLFMRWQSRAIACIRLKILERVKIKQPCLRTETGLFEHLRVPDGTRFTKNSAG